jgi:hypothetical protein
MFRAICSSALRWFVPTLPHALWGEVGQIAEAHLEVDEVVDFGIGSRNKRLARRGFGLHPDSEFGAESNSPSHEKSAPPVQIGVF